MPAIHDSHEKPMDWTIDSTGFKIVIWSNYLGSKRNKKRGRRSKLYAVISIHNMPVISFSITYDHFHDSKEERKVVKNLRDRVKRIFCDKGYRSKVLYNIFDADSMVPARNNSSSKCRGSLTRMIIVRCIGKAPENEWKESVGYRKRLIVEDMFLRSEKNHG